jgi:Cof subfamily protein (haloacid dehalogenase superfamily)
MAVKLVACDLDGTLIGKDLTFSPRLLRTVERSVDRGITVTLATGRGYPSTVRFANRLGIAAPLICYQGAQIRTMQGGTLYACTFPGKYLPDVVAFCRQGSWELSIYCDDQIYQSTWQRDQAYYDRWFGLPVRRVDDLLSALPGPPIKFICSAPTKALCDALEPDLRALSAGQYQVVRSHPWFVEGIALEVSKGDGLARLAQRLGVCQQEVMALGDSDNDASMLRWAGWGVAMGDARPAARQAADAIAPSQAQDGAAWAIERYALGEDA